MFSSNRLIKNLIVSNIRQCHHDRPVKLQDYHIIGLHNNLTKLVKEITDLHKTVQQLEIKITCLELQLKNKTNIYNEMPIKTPHC